MEAPLRPSSKLLWLFIFVRGGELADHTRPAIARHLQMSHETITNSAGELEAAGWMKSANRGQGRPKWYRCLCPSQQAELPLTESADFRFPGSEETAFSAAAAIEQAEIPLSNATEIRFQEIEQPVCHVQEAEIPLPESAEIPLSEPIRLGHDQVGQDIHLARVEFEVLDSVVSFNRIETDELRKKPSLMEKPKPRSRPDLLAKLPAQEVTAVENKLWELFGEREGLPALGPGGDPIAALLLSEAKPAGWGVARVLREMDRVWSIRYHASGEPKSRTQKICSWGYLLSCLRGALPDRIPVRRETRVPMQHASGETCDKEFTNGIVMGLAAGVGRL